MHSDVVAERLRDTDDDVCYEAVVLMVIRAMPKLMGCSTGDPDHETIAAGDSGETCGHPEPPSCR